MEEDLRTILLADTALTALVGARINWGVRPQGDNLPAIAMFAISGAEGYHLTGKDGLFQGRVQIDCFGTSYGAAKLTGRAVIDVLHTFTDANFSVVLHIGSREDRESGSSEADRPFRQSLDFSVNWKG